LPAAPVSAADADLGGSRASIREQNEIAKEHDFTFLRTAAQVREFVAKERLVEVVPNEDLLVSKVSFPYTRPILKTFIERLAAQYRRATGEQLVVTSLTRPTSMQPRNASPLSVHPAGMAVDFRVPKTAAERQWLEATLLSLEDRGLLDVTRERRPPHYHVAVFPDEYESYVAKLIPHEMASAAAAAASALTSAGTTMGEVAVAAAANVSVRDNTVPTIIMLGAAFALLLTVSAPALSANRSRRRQ
ncbi:MAG TPA: DUF5715 family protein, partial [Gemmatimonadaceae bacterium]|nr:DUF5715 family protein [Gemmatimonadaceae bacterium]